MTVIIDGYNLLWVIPKTSGGEPLTDTQLCRILSAYFKITGQPGEIIFDGVGPPDKSVFDNISNLDVIFAGADVEADAVIEDKIASSTAPRNLVIVSSDRRLRKAAHARKAISVKSEAFWGEVQKQLKRSEKFQEPTSKQHGITEGETKQWLKIFDLDK